MPIKKLDLGIKNSADNAGTVLHVGEVYHVVKARDHWCVGNSGG